MSASYEYRFTCQNEQCAIETVRILAPGCKQKPRFCSRACANAWQRGRSMCERFTTKYGLTVGEERAAAYAMTMSSATSGERNPMHGHTHTDDAKRRIGERCKDKSLEQIYGEQRAADIRACMSAKTSGALNPAWGKVYARSGRSIKGWYKGVFFRSLFELSFMLHLERKEGIDVTRDLDYEAHLIQWSGGTYRPDFEIPAKNLLFEVKPRRLAATPKNLAKFEAARAYCAERGIEFRVVTEDDFEKLSFDEALKVEGVKWDERTFEYFKK